MTVDTEWPPGTVRLANITHHDEQKGEIILQPRPTSDPNDPLNWPKPQKWFNYLLGSFYAMIVYSSVNATAPTWGPLADELHFSSTLLTQTYAIGCAGLAIGAPMLIPFALKYGSRSVYLVSTICQLGIMVWAARTETAADWWAVNFLQCWLGALCEVLVNLTISDVFFVHQRGLMNSIYIWVMNIGGNLSLVPAGYVTVNQGWRWVWWWFAIFFAIQFVLFFFGFEETKFPGRVREKVEDRQGSVSGAAPKVVGGEVDSSATDEKKLVGTNIDTAETGSSGDASIPITRIPIDYSIPRKTYLQKLALFTVTPGRWSQFLRHSWQPFAILFTIPGVAFSALCYGILLANNTAQTAALSQYMIGPPYNFTAAQIGLMNLAPFIGNTLGTLVCGPLSDWIVIRMARKNNGIYEPEMRFWVFLPFVPFQIAGAWWFGYALADGRPWWTVALAYGICNFGLGPLQSLVLTFLIDAYGDVVADALTALTFVRNMFSTIFVFAMPAWISGVGIANIFNTISAISIVILCFATVFIWKGKTMRVKTAGVYAYYAERQFDIR